MSSSPFRASPRQRVIVAVLALLLLLALTTVVPWLTYVGGGKRAVEARMTELRNAGYTLTLEELNEEYHGHSFEPADNAAPVYEAAFAKLTDPSDGGERTSRLREKLLGLGADETVPRETVEELVELLKQNADALELVREASRRPYARFDLDFTEGFALLLPHISSMRDAVRLLEAVLRWLDGDMDGAAENIETMLAVAEHLQAEKTLLAQLAGIAMVAITLESLGWLLERDAFSPMILERLDSSLRWHETNPRILVGMVGEVAFANAIFTTPPFEMLGEDWEGGITGDGQWLTFLYALSGRVHWDHSFYLEAMRERLEHMREPHEKWSTYSDTASEMEIDEKRYLFSGLLLPNGTNLFRVEVHTVARLRIARILLALERHRSETGSLPETFDPLAPRFLPEVPMDPVPGRPFTVKRESDFLIIESFGRMRQGPDREERPIAGRLPVVREVE